MRAILVDDEVTAAAVFEYEAKNIKEIDLKGVFQTASEALDYASHNEVELAFLDVQINDMNGITLGSELRKIFPEIMLIYITGYEQYAIDAVKMHAAGYLTKPYSAKELSYAVESARLLSKRKKSRVFARTFGHFDLFVDGKPIMFKSAKAKEMLAILVDRRGGTVTSDQVIGLLWEDRPNDEATQNLCSKVGKTLKKELQDAGIEDIFVTARGNRRIDTDLVDCDLYNLLDGDARAREQYLGEYMVDYSWAEEKMALLEKYVEC